MSKKKKRSQTKRAISNQPVEQISNENKNLFETLTHLISNNSKKSTVVGILIAMLSGSGWFLATADFEHYCAQSGFEFLESYNENKKIIIRYKFIN